MLITKNLNLKLVILVEHQNIKMFWQKVKNLTFKKVENTEP